MNCSCRKPEFNSSTYVRPFVNTNIRRIWCFWPPPSLALIYIYKDTHTDTKFKKDLFKVNQGRRHSGKFLYSQHSEGKGRQVSLGSRPALSTYTEFQTSLDCIMRPRQPIKNPAFWKYYKDKRSVIFCWRLWYFVLHYYCEILCYTSKMFLLRME